MESLSLRDAVQPEIRGNVAKFARKVGVTRITAWRWTLPADHPDHAVPRIHLWPAIEAATDHRWHAPYSEFNHPKRKPRALAVSIAASRKAAATRRRQRQAN